MRNKSVTVRECNLDFETTRLEKRAKPMVWPPIPSPDSQDSTCQQQVSKRRIVLSPLKHHVAQVWANQRFVTDEHTSRQQHVMHAQADWVLFLEKKTTTIKCQTLIYYPLKQMRCFCVRPV